MHGRHCTQVTDVSRQQCHRDGNLANLREVPDPLLPPLPPQWIDPMALHAWMLLAAAMRDAIEPVTLASRCLSRAGSRRPSVQPSPIGQSIVAGVGWRSEEGAQCLMSLTLLKRTIYALVWRPIGFIYMIFDVFGKFTLPKQTALDIVRPLVDSRTVAVVTGCNTGIGYEIALALSRAGATIFVCCRTKEKCAETVERIRKHGGRGALEPIQLELSSLASVRAAADAVNTQTAHIDYLILNAGVMNIPSLELSSDGYEMHFAVNHLGHYLFTRRLVAKVRKAIVVVGSGFYIMGAIDAVDDVNWDRRGRDKYDGMAAYADSKMANTLFAVACNRQYPSIRTIAVNPGAVLTELMRHSATPVTQRRLRKVLKHIFRSPTEGALAALAALADTASTTTQKKPPLYYRDGRPSRAVVEGETLAADRLWEESEHMVRAYLA